MSTRIKSAAIAIILAIIFLILHKTILFNLAIGFISAVGIFELFRALKMKKFKAAALACYIFAIVDAVMPFFFEMKIKFLYFFSFKLYFGIFILFMCLYYLKHHEKFSYVNFFGMIGITVALTYAFGTLISMVNIKSGGVFLLVLSLCGAWLADSGAYFAGTFFGKTKLCPEISPKKTVEGLIGGVVCNGVFLLTVSFVYSHFLGGVQVNYITVFIAGMLCALIGLVGDLTASVIKRQTGIKDYGNIMPGHGGVLDRFDSVLLVAPFMHYLFTQGLIFK